MVAGKVVAVLTLLTGVGALASPPQLYRQPAYESPVTGGPDDLLLLAGFGFRNDDTVVYRAVSDTSKPATAPEFVPAKSTDQLGVAPIVSSMNVPYALTIKLPNYIRPGQTYALWIHTASGEWSQAVTINDARPLWATPAYVYATAMPAGLSRELKVVGRNLRPQSGQRIQVRIDGPQSYTGSGSPGYAGSSEIGDYVARFALPQHLATGHYRIMVKRDGASWVRVEGQSLEVRPDPKPDQKYSVSDPRFGGCQPDDGIDDTACIVRAVDAAVHAGGGSVYLGPGTWDLIHGDQSGMVPYDGIAIPPGVSLQGAGSALTTVQRHAEWNARADTPAFTLIGGNRVSEITFKDLQLYRLNEHGGPFLQIGDNWHRAVTEAAGAPKAVVDSIVTGNIFDKPDVAIGVGGIPIEKLFITHNIFGAYNSALELSGDWRNVTQPYRIDDSVIAHNVFKPGSKLGITDKSGTIASEVGAGHRLDFSNNEADGTSIEFQYSPLDAKGWRAVFFWNPTGSSEEVLVSQNTLTCTGDKIGDGEAIAFDNNTNAFAFARAAVTRGATSHSVTVSEPMVAKQHDVDIDPANFYVGHWVQIVSGAGLGQVRKVVGYTTDTAKRLTTIEVAPAWDVAPLVGSTRIAIGREYWQVYVVGNHVDNRRPLCQKSNRSRRAAGTIGLWGTSADTVFARNEQYDSDGIGIEQEYGTAERPCTNCSMMGFFNYFLEVRDNLIDGEYDWDSDCSHSGIQVGAAATPWEAGPPPTVGFGVSIAHNTIRHADAEDGGAIGQSNIWWTGPEPHRWFLSDNMLIHHNSISEIEGVRARATCGKSPPRVGIAFPDPVTAGRTVLYANSCKQVSLPIGLGGMGIVKVCPSSVPDSCECLSH